MIFKKNKNVLLCDSRFLRSASFIYLQFNTKYYYEVGIGHSPRKFWFVTPPKVGLDVPYTFGLIGILFQYQNCAIEIAGRLLTVNYSDLI